ncbi:MAG: aldo/keto reductase [Chloroflexi bacterium]|nr:aldo/keto reductase [Chloroflexota bacterium]
MEYRRLGRSGVKVSTISLGNWLTHGGYVEEQNAIACVRRAYDLGINFFDTANAYNRGAAEQVLGRGLRAYDRSSYFLATKAYWPMGDGPNDRGLSRKHLIEQCNASLRRLGVEYVDLYQCHRYDTNTPLDETLRAIDDLITQGKVLYAGVSEWTADQIGDAVTYSKEHDLDRIVSNQPQYSILYRTIERDVIPLCEREGIGQVVWSPLAQGVLTGKYRPGQAPPADSRAAAGEAGSPIRGFLGEDILTAVEKLRPIAERNGLTMSQLALAWVLRQQNVSSAIIGASRPEQIDDNVGAAGVTLDPATLTAIDEAVGSVAQR